MKVVRSSNPNSRAFTLVELLVAIAIIIMLMSIVLAFLPKREVRLASQGADQLQTYIASAKSRALKDNAPRGIRLLADGQGRFREFQYIEVPEPYIPSGATMTVTQALPNQATFGGFNLSAFVQVGDMLEITHGSPSIHRIVTGSGANTTNLNTGQLALASPVPAASNSNLTLTQNFRFIRQPRPLMGENTLVLPDKVFVAPDSSLLPTPTNTGSQNIPQSFATPVQWEILFSPSGQVINARGGRIVLWVADDNNVSKPTLLTVYSYTGAVGAHPEGPAGNPYLFTQDGRSSGQ